MSLSFLLFGVIFHLIFLQANDELQRLRREYIRSPKSPKTSLTAQAILRRVENERDTLIGDLRRMTTERDSLRERLKVSDYFFTFLYFDLTKICDFQVEQEQAMNERSRLEQRCDDVESNARALGQERVDMQVSLLVL